jgi:hypothetical protein
VKSLMLFGVLVVSGCSSFQASHYENRSTAAGTVVTATGKAAEVAAAANTSHNCPSCASGPSSASRTTQQQNQVERVVTSAIDTTSYEISRTINDAIRGLFD